MLRMRLDALDQQAGLLYLHGKLFTGVAYEVESARVTANYQVTQGVRGGPAEVWAPDRPRALVGALKLVTVDQTDEHFPSEGAYLDGVPFDGVAYHFHRDTGALIKEEDLHPTRPGPTREWDSSGVLQVEFDRPGEDGETESERWYKNGQSQGIQSLDMGFGCTEDGRLRSLNLQSGYRANALARVPFRVGSTLGLAGPGISDEILERLLDMSCVEDLELRGTGISARGLERFLACTNLKKLRTRRNPGFGLADIQLLLARIPGCAWDGRLT